MCSSIETQLTSLSIYTKHNKPHLGSLKYNYRIKMCCKSLNSLTEYFNLILSTCSPAFSNLQTILGISPPNMTYRQATILFIIIYSHGKKKLEKEK